MNDEAAMRSGEKGVKFLDQMRGTAIQIMSNKGAESYKIIITLDSEMMLGLSLSDLAFAMDEETSESMRYFFITSFVIVRAAMLIIGLYGFSFEYFTVPDGYNNRIDQDSSMILLM